MSAVSSVRSYPACCSRAIHPTVLCRVKTVQFSSLTISPTSPGASRSPPPVPGVVLSPSFCLHCAKHIFVRAKTQGDAGSTRSGPVEGPFDCVRSGPGLSCLRCKSSKAKCLLMPECLRSNVEKLRGMVAGNQALEAQERLRAFASSSMSLGRAATQPAATRDLDDIDLRHVHRVLTVFKQGLCRQCMRLSVPSVVDSGLCSNKCANWDADDRYAAAM
ncbi:hypothetical protein BDV18DRAFT_161359 [Aspergillus unguis]